MARERLSSSPTIIPRQQPNGPPFASPCASGGRALSGEAVEVFPSPAGCSARGVERSVDSSARVSSSGLGEEAGSNWSCVFSDIELERSKLTIASVTQTRQDIPAIVQALVQLGDIDINIGMRLRELEQAIGRGENTNIRETRNSAFFQDSDGIDGRSARGQHGVDSIGDLEIDLVRQAIIILLSLERTLITPQTQVPDLRF